MWFIRVKGEGVAEMRVNIGTPAMSVETGLMMFKMGRLTIHGCLVVGSTVSHSVGL